MLSTQETNTTGVETEAKPNTRKEVLDAYTYGQNKYLIELGKKSDDQLTEEEKADKAALLGALKLKPKNEYTFVNKIPNPTGGEDIKQEEGVPVEGIIDFLEKRLSENPPKNERAAIEKNLKILQANSEYYIEKYPDQKIKLAPGEEDTPEMAARKKQEAYYVSKDHRNTGDELENYRKGEAALARRRWLKVPARGASPVPLTETATPPTGIPGETILPENLEAAENGEGDDLNPEPGEISSSIEPEDGEETESTEEAVTEPEVEPEITQPLTHERIEVGVIRDDDVIDKNAALQARKDFHERMSKGKMWEFWRWPEKIALKLSEGGIENIQQERLRRACIKNGVSFLETDLVKNAASAANIEQTETRQASLLERFAAGRIVRRENAEKPIVEEKILLAEDSPLRASLLSDVIKPLVDGQITGSRTEQRKQIQDKLTAIIKDNLKKDPKVEEIFGAQASDYGYAAEYFATDLLEKSLAIKDQMDKHKESLEQISAYIDLHIGIARDQASTDVRNAVDRAVAKARQMQNETIKTTRIEARRKLGWILNPATVGIATSLGTYGIMRSVGFTGRVAGIAAPITGAMGGAVVAGAQRYIEIGADKRMSEAEMALGQVIPEKQKEKGALEKLVEKISGGYNRKDLAQFRYDSVKTVDLINGTNGSEITNPLDRGKPPQKRTLISINELITLPLDISPDMDENTRTEREENRKAVAERMEEIRIRINRSRRERVDLLTFSDKTKVNEELNNLYSAADRLELALREKGADIDALANEADQAWMDAFDNDKRQKDKEFREYRVKKAVHTGAFGGAVGLGSALTTGAFMQYGAAELARHIPSISQMPVAGGLFQPGQTVLEKATHNVGTVLGHPEIGTGPATADTFKELFGSGGRVNIGNIVAEANPDHTLNFLDKSGNPIPNMPQGYIEADGKVIISGNVGSLPGEMQGWAQTETLDHSLKQQIQEAVQKTADPSSESIKMAVGNDRLAIKGNVASIIAVDQNGNTIASARGTITPEGTFQFSSVSGDLSAIQNELQNNGFQTQIENAGGLAGEGAKEHFEKLGMIEKANRGEFLNNGTPGIYDKNELKLHLLSKPDGTVIVDASKMIQENTIPQSVNKDILTKADGTRTYKNFFAQFTFDNAGDNAREVVRLPMDASGQVTLPKGADLNQFFKVNPDGSVTQNLRFTEIAHLNEATGKYDILATSTGPEATLKPTTVLNATPPMAHEFVPPSPEAPPIIPIPIPFAPRNPLEPLNDESKIYYLMPITEERKKLFAQNRSQTLTENPNSILDPKTEVQQYMQKQSPEYKQKIDELVEQITAPPSPNLRAVVCIPVAGHEEGEHIYDTLLNYSYQDAPKDQYEILLFVNNPEGTNLDKTVDEIKRFQQDHPDLPVRMMYKQLPKSEAKMAVIRKYLNDAALQRNINLINGGRDLILISNDADLRGMAPEYISNFIDKFDKDPKMDALVGQLDWDPASYVEYPVIHAGTRLFQYLNILLWNGRGGDRPSSGASTAFKSSIYAGVGGYQINEMPGAEDVILGQAIRTARGSSNSMGYAGARVSRLYTSSRRAIDAWATGFAPIEQWDRNWGAINEQVRRLKLGQHQTVNYDDPAVIEQLKTDLEKVIGRTLNYFGDSDNKLDAPLFKRAVSFLGISYTLNPNGGIEITDMNSFIKGIKRFQQKGEILQQVKSGKLPKSALIQFEEESTIPATVSTAPPITITEEELNAPPPPARPRGTLLVNLPRPTSTAAPTVTPTPEATAPPAPEAISSAAQLSNMAGEFQKNAMTLIGLGVQGSGERLSRIGNTLSNLATQAASATGEGKTAIINEFRRTLADGQEELRRLNELRETITPQIGAQTVIAYNRIKELASQFKTATGERKNTIAADLAQIIGQVEASTGTKLREDNAPLSDRNLERVERTINEIVRNFQQTATKENIQAGAQTGLTGAKSVISNIAGRFRRPGAQGAPNVEEVAEEVRAGGEEAVQNLAASTAEMTAAGQEEIRRAAAQRVLEIAKTRAEAEGITVEEAIRRIRNKA